jgi:hypothetical protein
MKTLQSLAWAMLLVIIKNMNTISFSAVKKSLLLLFILVGLSCASTFADALMLSVKATPYDHQMSPIREVLTTGGSSTDHTSLALVNTWMSDLRNIPYGFQMVWKTPSEVESGRPADCKGKAVALYKRMKSQGATNLRLVIGKRAPSSRQTHAWLEWQTESGSYVLDPTFNYSVTRAERVGRGCYVPFYAYSGTKKFRASTNLIAQN